MTIQSFADVSDRELLDRVTYAASDQREATIELLQLLGEVDLRRLYLPEGCSSLFIYCTQVLRFSEYEAYERIDAARAARKFPVVLNRLREGALTVTSVRILRPHLRTENVDALVEAASHKSTREVQRLVASVAPKPDVKPMVRRLPDPLAARSIESRPVAIPAVTPTESKAEPPPPRAPTQPAAPRPIVAPLSAGRYLLRVTLSADAHAKLERARNLLRHSTPTADPADVIDRALTLLVEALERRKLAEVKNPRLEVAGGRDGETRTRHIPAVIRRVVWKRDGGRCAFVGNQGRCRETGQLEFHHVEPFAHGGATTIENLELRCRAHNQYEGALQFDVAADSTWCAPS